MPLTSPSSAHRVAEEARLAQACLLLETLPAYIAVYELQTLRCLFANQRYAEFYDCPAEQIVGMDLQAIIGLHGYLAARPMIDTLVRTKTSVPSSMSPRAS